jgi:hypothetical protein
VNFSIHWRDAALDDLAAIWLKAEPTQRVAITKATHSIELELKSQPSQKGESRPEGERILFSSPIGVLFHVEDDDCRVIIEQIWLFATE